MLVTWLISVWMAWGALGSHVHFYKNNNQDGRCIYSFAVPSKHEDSCTGLSEVLISIQNLQRESKAQQLELESTRTRLGLLENQVNQLHGSQVRRTSLSTVDLLQREIESLKREQAQRDIQISSLESTINELLQDKSALEEEKKRLAEEKNELERRLENSIEEVAQLRVSHCLQTREGSSEFLHSSQKVSKWDTENLGYQEFKLEFAEVSASHLIEESTSPSPPSIKAKEQGCGTLVWVGAPVTFHRADTITGKYGVWMKDPYSNETIWRVDTVSADVCHVFEYDDMDEFVKSYPSKVHVLPRSMESTGTVVYQGFLYFQRHKSRILVKYDLKNEVIAVQKELPDAGYHGQFPYSWGAYTDIDLAVDEIGLWVIYGTENTKGAIVLSKLDPETLEISQTCKTNIHKQSVANSFMICGSLYTISSYSSPEATVNFIYHISTGNTALLKIRFENRYRYSSMVDYNPTEKKIMAWDNFNMVAYDIRLSKM
ncbi:myocilin [Protobothrops mucrosquamatus]|uniref:myocilin n=1 Tax=Protobothrops mucrosquamatus TaxID=103944 RepID=UPI000775A0F5|nr:myocilin [Protobothrops mucrosquamatus]